MWILVLSIKILVGSYNVQKYSKGLNLCVHYSWHNALHNIIWININDVLSPESFKIWCFNNYSPSLSIEEPKCTNISYRDQINLISLAYYCLLASSWLPQQSIWSLSRLWASESVKLSQCDGRLCLPQVPSCSSYVGNKGISWCLRGIYVSASQECKILELNAKCKLVKTL